MEGTRSVWVRVRVCLYVVLKVIIYVVNFLGVRVRVRVRVRVCLYVVLKVIIYVNKLLGKIEMDGTRSGCQGIF